MVRTIVGRGREWEGLGRGCGGKGVDGGIGEVRKVWGRFGRVC